MKRIILWLAKVFNVELPKQEIVKEVVKEVKVYDGDVVDEDLIVKGDLTVNGTCKINGELTVFKTK